MEKIKGWLTAGIYKTPTGFSLQSLQSEKELLPTGNAICSHGLSEVGVCNCGFFSIANYEGALSEAVGLAIVEVSHLSGNTTVSNANVNQALTQDIVRIQIHPQCFDCEEKAEVLTAIESSRHYGNGQYRIEPTCAYHAYGETTVELEELASYYKSLNSSIEVSWGSYDEIVEQRLFEDLTEIMHEAEEVAAYDAFVAALGDEAGRQNMKAKISQAPEAALYFITLLTQLGFEILIKNSDGIKEIFSDVDERLSEAIRHSVPNKDVKIKYIIDRLP